MQTNIPFSRQQRITNTLLLNASFIDNLGLMHGKMGIAIYFFHLARETGNSIYEEYAGELIDEIYKEIHAKTQCDFENGLAGIGWGIEYLLRNKFIDADPNEVLEEFDSQIIHEITFHAPDDVGILYGLNGYILYFLSRLQSNTPGSTTYEILNNSLKETLNKLQKRIEEHSSDILTDDIWKEPEIFNLTWNYPNALWVLVELVDNVLFITQSEHMIKQLLKPLEEGRILPKLQSHRLMVALVLEKIKRFKSGNILKHIPENLNGTMNESINHENIASELVQNSVFLKNGTSGISFIYKWFFKTTKNPYYLKESEYWKSRSFELPESDLGFAGFYYEKRDESSVLGILEGISGINLQNHTIYDHSVCGI